MTTPVDQFDPRSLSIHRDSHVVEILPEVGGGGWYVSMRFTFGPADSINGVQRQTMPSHFPNRQQAAIAAADHLRHLGAEAQETAKKLREFIDIARDYEILLSACRGSSDDANG